MKVFLGYASEHLDAAREIYTFLKEFIEDVWFDKESLTGGDDWDRERSEAQRTADFIIHLISEEVFSRAGVVNREIRQTLKQVEDQPIGASYALFVRLDDLRMPAELIRFQYVDHFRLNWREQLSKALSKRAEQLNPAEHRSQSQSSIMTERTEKALGREPSQVKNSFINDFYELNSTYLQYGEEGLYWQLVNTKIASETLSGFIRYSGIFSQLDEDDKNRIREYGTPYVWETNMQEFFHQRDLLSIRSSYFWHMGGAHPNHGITTLNFLGQKYGFCTIKDILGHREECAYKLLDYCEKVLAAMLEAENATEYMSNAFKERRYTWQLVSQYNFDQRGITINFSPYDVLPYAFGSHEVFVPWRVVTPLLADPYQNLEQEVGS
ncbi:TIR domain-containing protein [Acidimangrovimonas sediminis]|uniref:TIR domain-containing protein n=1 Tax=Acidimangrovimonas sediminis TaxID=2056283 RepID=UPI0013048618|nr:TIR domain-containing protein [Acidimangrovimonas sediminis]